MSMEVEEARVRLEGRAGRGRLGSGNFPLFRGRDLKHWRRIAAAALRFGASFLEGTPLSAAAGRAGGGGAGTGCCRARVDVARLALRLLRRRGGISPAAACSTNLAAGAIGGLDARRALLRGRAIGASGRVGRLAPSRGRAPTGEPPSCRTWPHAAHVATSWLRACAPDAAAPSAAPSAPEEAAGAGARCSRREAGDRRVRGRCGGGRRSSARRSARTRAARPGRAGARRAPPRARAGARRGCATPPRRARRARPRTARRASATRATQVVEPKRQGVRGRRLHRGSVSRRCDLVPASNDIDDGAAVSRAARRRAALRRAARALSSVRARSRAADRRARRRLPKERGIWRAAIGVAPEREARPVGPRQGPREPRLRRRALPHGSTAGSRAASAARATAARAPESPRR